MKLRKFNDADWSLFVGAVGEPLIAEYGDSYVVIVDAYGLTISRYDEDRNVDSVTIDMLPSQAELLVGSMEPDVDTFNALINDAQPDLY